MKNLVLVLIAGSFAIARAQHHHIPDPNDPKKIGKSLMQLERAVTNLERQIENRPLMPPILYPMAEKNDEDNLDEIMDMIQKLRQRIMKLNKPVEDFIMRILAAGNMARAEVIKDFYDLLKKELVKASEGYQKLSEKKKMDAGKNEMLPFPPAPPLPHRPEEEHKHTMAPTKGMPKPHQPEMDHVPFNLFQKLMADKLKMKINFLKTLQKNTETLIRIKSNWLKMFQM